MLIIVPCGAKKRTTPSPARELYIGAMFSMTWRAAEALKARHGGRVLILSGLHGLVDPETVLAPYEMRMGMPGSVQPGTLRAQAEAFRTDAAEVIVLGGKDYAKAAITVWPHAQTPLVGLSGIGYQRGALSKIITATDQALP